MLIQGTAKWAKILGKPHAGYENAYNEWSIDVYVNAETAQRLKDEGLGKRLKNKGNGDYITFKRKEFKADGSPNQPIRVVDHRGQPWDGTQIGNGSTVNVNFAINTYGAKNEKTATILSLQVWDLVKYEGGDGFPTREDANDESWANEVA